MGWAIALAVLVVVYLIISKLDAIVKELKQIRLLLNESESEKFKRKREEFREPES